MSKPPLEKIDWAAYEHFSGKFWMRCADSTWMRVSQQNLILHLKKRNDWIESANYVHKTEIDNFIVQLQHENKVDYAGSLAGHWSGLHSVGGQAILVTDSPRLITPVIGDCWAIEALLRNLFGDEQYSYVISWLKIGYESLKARQLRTGQSVIMAGPRGGGKSLWQNLITLILGGRSGKPFRYMTGKTQFNADYFGTEHLLIEDELTSIIFRDKQIFAENLKAVAANQTHSCHGKNKQALSLNPFWRLTVSLNDEGPSLAVLPKIESSLEDKLLLLQTYKKPMPMPTGTSEQYAMFWKTLVEQLPAFVNFLEGWKVPDICKGDRFGVAHYGNPMLISELQSTQPHIELLALIDRVIFCSKSVPAWEGTAMELEDELRQMEPIIAGKLLRFTYATGTFLGHLYKDCPARVQPQRSALVRRWRILPPEK